ncbi:MAG TPA: hypothetical protein VIF15_11375 [Polyangiaceae bacterium]|jgi:hypothetical protein
MLRSVLPAALALAVGLVGCILFTGGTDGYSVPPPVPCQSAADCSSKQVCCAAQSSSSSVTETCQSACGALAVQICVAADECDTGKCVAQSCAVDGGAVAFRACTLVPTCTVTTATDAGAEAGD